MTEGIQLPPSNTSSDDVDARLLRSRESHLAGSKRSRTCLEGGLNLAKGASRHDLHPIRRRPTVRWVGSSKPRHTGRNMTERLHAPAQQFIRRHIERVA